jgi:hypothetical protein
VRVLRCGSDSLLERKCEGKVEIVWSRAKR